MRKICLQEINGMNDIEQLRAAFVSYMDEAEKEIEKAREEARQFSELYDWLLEQLKQLKRDKYGKKSESVFNLQLSLFEESSCRKSDDKLISADTAVSAHIRKKKVKADFSNLEKEVYHHDIEDKTCPKCHNPLIELKPTVKQVIRYEKGRYVLEEHIIHNYICNNCNSDDSPLTLSGRNYYKLIDNSIVSPSLMAKIIDDKFTKSLPLYRQEQDFIRNGVAINRQNMSNWLFTIAENYISPLLKLMNEDLLGEDIIYGDETTLKCLEFRDRNKSYIWVRCSSPSSLRQIRLFDFSKGRDEAFAQSIYKGFEGYLHCDAYSVYRNIEGTITVACMAHARRYVFEAINTSKLYEAYRKLADEDSRRTFLEEHKPFKKLIDLLVMIDKLFELERIYKDEKLDYETIRLRRLSEARPILERISTYLDENQNTFLKKSKAGEAITYLSNNYEQLCNYLNDGRLELSNSLAERTIKNVVIGRKNFLFANTAQGARYACIYYSLIETAKANNVKPYHYIKYLLEKMVNLRFDDEEYLRSLLPYSECLPDCLKVNRNHA